MATLAGDSAKSAKSLAKQVAKQMAREPLEILKTAGQQVASVEQAPAPQGASGVPLTQEISPQEKAKIEVQGQRQLAALENEIKDIQNKKLQEAAIKVQQEQAVIAESQTQEKELPNVPAKRSRRLFGFGQKAQAEKQKTRVEKPLPPSG
jgi:hypothetical protein